MSEAATSNLRPLGEAFGTTREALHALASKTVSPARKPEGEISLRQTPGGFGTPWFWDDGAFTQLRVDGAELLTDRDGKLTRKPLDVDADAARQLGDWFEFGAAVLWRFHHNCGEELDPSPIRLWPEHFDIALEAGPEKAGRANYGASPGDAEHPEPYLYVGPWSGEAKGDFWNATAFSGAELLYAELLEAPDQLAAALEFLRRGLRTLTDPG